MQKGYKHHSDSPKRRRIPSKSCEFCKKRKVKCDRLLPCSQCTRANVECKFNNWIQINNSTLEDGRDVGGGNKANFGSIPVMNGPIMETELATQKNSRDAISSSVSNEEMLLISKKEFEMLRTRIEQLEGNHDISKEKSNEVSGISSFSSDKRRTFEKAVDDILKKEKVDNPYGLNPVKNSIGSINFYCDYSPIYVKNSSRCINYGPFSWLACMKKDPFLLVLWKYMMEQGNKKTIYDGAVEEDPKIASAVKGDGKLLHDELDFKKKSLESEGYNDLISYERILESRDPNIKSDLTLSLNNLMLRFKSSDEIYKELQLIERIKLALPKQKVIWKLIDRFFNWLYVFMPLLDEVSFEDSISQIIGKRGYSDIKLSKINVTKKLDLANLGILLTVLRLAYSTLFCNNDFTNNCELQSDNYTLKAKETKYLVSNPITVDFVDMALCCLSQFSLHKRTNLTILQCAIFLKLYHMYAHEGGDGLDGSDSPVSHGSLIEMAFSLGINREPEKSEEFKGDLRRNHLCRKIWCTLLTWDIYYSFTFGIRSHITTSSYDTKMPFYTKGCENISVRNVEDKVIESYSFIMKFYSKTQEILGRILRIEEYTCMSELASTLNDLEILCKELFNNHAKVSEEGHKGLNLYGFVDTIKIKLCLDIKVFLISIYHHIYLHYEKSKEKRLSFFYFKKMILISTSQVLPHYFLLVNRNTYCDFMTNPSVEMAIHKSSQVILSALVRFEYYKFFITKFECHKPETSENKELKDRYSNLVNIVGVLKKCAEACIVASEKIQNRYYYAWRITKTQKILVNTLSHGAFFSFNQENVFHLRECIFTDQELKELKEACETPLMQISKLNFILDSEGDHDLKSDISHSDTKMNGVMSGETLPSNYFSTPDTVNSFPERDITSYDNYIDQQWMELAVQKHFKGLNDDTIFDSGIQGSFHEMSYDHLLEEYFNA